MSVTLAKSDIARSADLADISDHTIIRALSTISAYADELYLEAANASDRELGETLEARGDLIYSLSIPLHRERIARFIPLPLFA